MVLAWFTLGIGDKEIEWFDESEGVNEEEVAMLM